MKRIFTLAATICVAVITGAYTPALASPAQEAPVKKSIVGTWLASFDGGTHIGYMQWQSGGTLQASMDFAPKVGNVLLGDWKENQDQSLSVYLTGWTYDDKGKNWNGSFVRTETDTLAGSSYSGSFEVTFYDLDGNITFQHSGTLTASRVETQ